MILDYKIYMLINRISAQALLDVISMTTQEDLAALGIENVVADMTAKVTAFNNILVQKYASDETQKLEVLDDQRDNLILGIQNIIKPYLTFPSKAENEAAHHLDIAIAKYGKEINRLSYSAESATITNIVTDLQSEEYTADVTLLGLDKWVMDLKECNDKFIEKFQDREKEASHVVKGGTKAARKEAENAFYNFCETVNAHIKISNEEPYQNLVNNVNSVIAKAKADNNHRGPHNNKQN